MTREQFKRITINFKFLLFCTTCFFPLIGSKLPFLKAYGYLDELALTILILSCLPDAYRNLSRRSLILGIILSLYAVYSLYQILLLNLPYSNAIQIFLYLKMPLVFMIFYTQTDVDKSIYFRKLMTLFDFIFISSLIITIPHYLFPIQMGSLSHDGRGLFGVCMQGILYSRVHFSQFLLLYFILKSALLIFDDQTSSRKLLGFSALVFLCLALTFSRKELLLFLAMQSLAWFYFIKSRYRLRTWYLTQLPLILFASVAFLVLFEDINAKTFVPEQVRLVLLNFAQQAFTLYFPVGSGPGTFGSVMSLRYTELYQALGVSEYFYRASNRGPIFDIFLASFITESGLGFLIYLSFVLGMISLPANLILLQQRPVHLRMLRLGFILTLMGLSTVVPVFLTFIGFLAAAVLACISSNVAQVPDASE